MKKGWFRGNINTENREVIFTKIEVPTYSMPQNIEFDLSEAQSQRADIFIRMEENRIRANKMASIDKQIEIVKVLQRVFDNCSEKEVYIGGECYDTKLELEDICRGAERTLEDLVNEKLRIEKES